MISQGRALGGRVGNEGRKEGELGVHCEIKMQTLNE